MQAALLPTCDMGLRHCCQHVTVCIHGGASRALTLLLLLSLFTFFFTPCGVPQCHDRFFQADLQQEQEEGSVTSAMSQRTLVAASVMTTVTALPTNATMHVRVHDLVISRPWFMNHE